MLSRKSLKNTWRKVSDWAKRKKEEFKARRRKRKLDKRKVELFLAAQDKGIHPKALQDLLRIYRMDKDEEGAVREAEKFVANAKKTKYPFYS